MDRWTGGDICNPARCAHEAAWCLSIMHLLAYPSCTHWRTCAQRALRSRMRLCCFCHRRRLCCRYHCRGPCCRYRRRRLCCRCRRRGLCCRCRCRGLCCRCRRRGPPCCCCWTELYRLPYRRQLRRRRRLRHRRRRRQRHPCQRSGIYAPIVRTHVRDAVGGQRCSPTTH